ncbi:MAG: hypothetical protein OEN01_02690 [Candidatus Krumholzibacteria bacterium]|nr:hypothetical protein [Candidatus Krumholzibacteria bacterium]
MKKCKRIISAGTLVTLLVIAVASSRPQPGYTGEDDSARALLERSVAASGGVEAAGAWKTMVETGELTVHWEGWGSPRAKCSLRVIRPDKLVLDQDFSVYDHPFFFTYYYNGGDVWAVVNLGVRQNPRYTEAMTRAMKNTGGVYYYLSQCDTFFSVPEVPDDSLVVGSSVDRVGIVDDGDTVMVDLDRQTYFPVRLIRDGGAEQALFSDYRVADRLTVPFRMTTYQNGTVSSEYVWEQIRFDEPIDEAIFQENRPRESSSG